MTENQTVKLPRGEATRQAVLNAAETVFAEMGFSTARLEDVALAVGIRRASLIYYFRNKQELYDAVEAEIFAALHEHVRARLNAASGTWARLYAVLDAWLDFMVARPTAARIIQRNVADIAPRASDPVEFSESALNDFETTLREGQKDGTFAAVRPVHVINILGGGVLQYVCNGRQYGASRAYQADATRELAAFRKMLHAAARSVLEPDTKN